ncbi:MAG: hypothetical protein HYT61_00010 [Candidatus Yanofskybacteria bacterium]|nr:hypothetical protein [Candidatus Yanofskybacteria bacterium]
MEKETSPKQDLFFEKLEEQMKSPEGFEGMKESEEDRITRGLEEQMKSPEGLEGIEIAKEPQKIERKKRDPRAIEKRQKFWKEFWEWQNHYFPDSTGFENDEILKYLNPKVKFEDQNKFDLSLGFIDYLLANAFKGASESFSERLKDIVENLDKIIFVDIVTSGNQLRLELKSLNKSIYLIFEMKYPFNYKAGSLTFN